MTPSFRFPFTSRHLLFAGTLALASLASASAVAAPEFTEFESGQVRPISLSSDGKLLFAVNTPDSRLEVFKVNSNGLVHKASLSVGLEPVAVAVRNDHEVWVVNHLSDSVSVVEITDDGSMGRVVRTLLVGDEPRDIVFAGPGRKRAFVTTAHRGQHNPTDPQLETPGVGRADVWVFDAGNLGASLGGNPLTILTLFSDTPRALAVSPDGNRVYAAAFHSGNRTTGIHDFLIPDGFEANGGVPNPSTNFQGVPAPETGIIVKYNGQHWVDDIGRTWDDKVNFSLPDKDVFAIDATSNPPKLVNGALGTYAGVGTILYNMAVNPVSGKVYVSNTEARNDQRFEGPGVFAGHSVRGHFSENRITVLSGSSVTPRHLNKHLDYSAPFAPVPNADNEKSLALPTGMVVSKNGATLYVAALGSSKVGIYSTAQLENDTFVPSVANQVHVSGGGPTGLALDDDKHRLYVLTRFDDSISIINTQTRAEVGHVSMHNPEPASIVTGRRFLYDASFTSSRGDSACASCHVFGDFDSLSWNLGDPDGVPVPTPGPFVAPIPEINPLTGVPVPTSFSSMKGPMITQSLRGLANHGPMHWRGDRTGGNDAPSAQPDSGSFDEQAAFKKFSVAFGGLVGRNAPISDADMQAFTDFILQVTYPPNPIRALDNSLTPDEQAGRDVYFNRAIDSGTTCNGCHTLNPQGNPGVAVPGFFGTEGLSAFVFSAQIFKIPQLRNMYQKVGMFGFVGSPILGPGDAEFQGDQVRGFGFTHDGTADTLFRFHNVGFFAQSPANPEGFPPGPAGDQMRRQVDAFLFAFDSNVAPIVGQQTTLAAGNGAVAGPRVDLLEARAVAGDCDLIAKTRLFDQGSGFLYIGNGKFLSDRQALPPIHEVGLRWLASVPGHEVTFTCVPRGSGVRAAIDRDGDGFLDGDEHDAGSDPEDPDSAPCP